MLTYYNCRVFNELNFYSLSLFSTCFYSIFLYFSFKFHKITVKSGVDLSHGANWTRIVTSYFSRRRESTQVTSNTHTIAK